MGISFSKNKTDRANSSAASPLTNAGHQPSQAPASTTTSSGPQPIAKAKRWSTALRPLGDKLRRVHAPSHPAQAARHPHIGAPPMYLPSGMAIREVTSRGARLDAIQRFEAGLRGWQLPPVAAGSTATTGPRMAVDDPRYSRQAWQKRVFDTQIRCQEFRDRVRRSDGGHMFEHRHDGGVASLLLLDPPLSATPGGPPAARDHVTVSNLMGHPGAEGLSSYLFELAASESIHRHGCDGRLLLRVLIDESAAVYEAMGFRRIATGSAWMAVDPRSSPYWRDVDERPRLIRYLEKPTAR